MSDPDPSVSEDIRVRRAPERGRYDAETVHEIIDACLIAHVGTIRDGRPMVLPMFAVRDGSSLLLHGAPAAGTIRRGRGMDVCVEMTSVDGLVLARSALHHSLNFRSVVVVGEATPVDDQEEKTAALDLIVEKLVPGRVPHLRPTSVKEERSTAVLRVSLERASAKIRTGAPIDDDDDYGLGIWAGVVPVTTVFGEPIDDPRLEPGIAVPDHVVEAMSARNS